MLRRWGVKQGEQFEESADKCGLPRERLQLHLEAVTLSLERDALMYSHPFEGESRRVITTTDYMGDGCLLTFYVVLYKDITAQIKWVERTSLPEGNDNGAEATS